MFNLQFLLTRRCNQNCYYCNNAVYCNNQVEIDLDYYKYVLNIYYNSGVKNIRLELSGGEPGIISNIKDLIEISNKLNYIKKIFILSNGTLRKRFNNIQNFIGNKFDGYHEHTALDINGKNILYFDKDITFFNSEKYVLHVLVLNNITLNSLLNNFQYFLDSGLFNKNIDFKLLTPKVEPVSIDILNKTKIFYDKLFKINNLTKDTFSYALKNYSYIDRLIDLTKVNICSRISVFQYIDLDNKKIGQCSMQVDQSQKCDITEDNIKKTLQGNLFTPNNFCKNCIKYSDMTHYYFSRKVGHKKYSNIMIK